ncbi:universal stress protein [Pseudoduganella namucuonensis]|uniref:Nucleotide-binding universal stress protein, UspA family n=1 Tax=Pseudoduganella namucuonensis TaxID=1035707 RepID=A0A1I7KP11_9BURK|nr:universal stress protein [Pseudoduganella namucuonensis]SFU99182.1 Nucleotide-binding universal stress protein, UspA family [Pseudoduganella namucuonensis]
MFKHILLPVDGSEAGRAALEAGLRLARDCGARVTALHVLPDFHVFTYRPAMLEETREEFMQDSTEQGALALAHASEAARELRVECDTLALRSDQPHKRIVEAARERGCDLIAMASHGHLGLTGVLLGSVTHKVLVHSGVPVLVLRGA